MNAHSMIPHHLFVAALSGGRHADPQPCAPLPQVLVEPAGHTAAAWLEEKRRCEAVSAIALRQVLAFGVGRAG
jgi:hypothetical protein